MALACENIRFSSLFIAGDVSRGGTSATRQQKFHTDDVKSVRNPVRGADWSMEQLHCFSYCLRMTGKRQKATKVKCKCKESLTKQSIFVEYSLLQKKHLSFVGARWQMNTTLHRNPPKDKQNWTKLYLEPHDYRIYYVSLHWFASSVWNFCHRVADIPPRETSPLAKSEEKRMFSQATMALVKDQSWYSNPGTQVGTQNKDFVMFHRRT